MKSNMFRDLNITKKAPKGIVMESIGDILTDGNGNTVNTPGSNLITALTNAYKLSSDEKESLLRRIPEFTPKEIYKNFDVVTKVIDPSNITCFIAPFLNVDELLSIKASNVEDSVIGEIVDTTINWRNDTSEYTKLKVFEERTKSIISDPFKVMLVREIYSSTFLDTVFKEGLDVDLILDMIENEDGEIIKSTFFIVTQLICNFMKDRAMRDANLTGVDKIIKALIYKSYEGNNRTLLTKMVSYSCQIAFTKMDYIYQDTKSNDSNNEILGACHKLFNEGIMDEYTGSITENLINQLSDFEEEEHDKDAREIENIEVEFEDKLLNLLMDNNDIEVEMEQISHMLQLSVVHESKVADIAVRQAQGAQKGVRSAANVTRSAATDVNRVTKAVAEIPKPFTDLVKNTLVKIKDMDKDNRRDAVIKGGFKFKLFKLIKLGIKLIAAGGAIGVLGPVLGAISVLAAFALDSKLDSKYKKEVLHELEQELKIVDEKIDDARSDSDKKSKYELMRIKDKLEKDIRRIKLGLDHL